MMHSNKLQLQFILVLLGGLLVLSFFILEPFLAPLFLATIFATVLHPLYVKFLKVTKNREVLSTLAVVVLSVFCILIPLTFLGGQIFKESLGLYNSLSQGDSTESTLVTVLHNMGETSDAYISGTGAIFENLSVNTDIYLKQALAWSVQHLGVALSGASKMMLDFFVFFISLYYMLKDGPKLKEAIIKLSPLEDKDDRIVFNRLEIAVNSVLKGSLLVAMAQGVLAGIGFFIFGVPSAVLWGTITVIAALIPGIGTALVVLPCVAYLLLNGAMVQALGLLIWGLVLVGLIDNLLRPALVGRDLQMHPLFVLFSVLGGAVYFGPIGIFLGPLSVSLLFAFLSTYSYLINKVWSAEA